MVLYFKGIKPKTGKRGNKQDQGELFGQWVPLFLNKSDLIMPNNASCMATKHSDS